MVCNLFQDPTQHACFVQDQRLVILRHKTMMFCFSKHTTRGVAEKAHKCLRETVLAHTLFHIKYYLDKGKRKGNGDEFAMDQSSDSPSITLDQFLCNFAFRIRGIIDQTKSSFVVKGVLIKVWATMV